MIAELQEDIQLRGAPCPNCILCGSKGIETYFNLPDQLFGAGGQWNFKMCPNSACELLWLDPMPLPEDIGKAYRRYYTHLAYPDSDRPSWIKRLYRLAKRGYQANKYGYSPGNSVVASRNLGRLLPFFPLHRSDADADVRFLRALVNGRLLDVGCGSGEWLASMRERGWNVAGLDFDQDAVRVARQSGLDVGCGTLRDQNYASESFDAVTLHHVIEHVPDPLETLTECARILVNGGQLVLATPNSASLGHGVFREHWRGLEPPRHLHIFSVQSLRRVLEQAGFRDISIRPHVAPSVIYESDLLRRGRASFTRTQKRDWPSWIVAQCFGLAELGLVKFKPSLADCVVAVAVKHDSITLPAKEIV